MYKNDYNEKTMQKVHEACMCGRIGKLNELAKYVNLREFEGRTLLHIGHNVSYVRRLIALGADVNAKDDYNCIPLHYACIERDKNVVRVLINAGSNVNAKEYNGRTPLHNACHYGNTKAVELLLAAGAKVNVRYYDKTPLYLACLNNHLPIVKMLINAGAKFTYNMYYTESCLEVACDQRNFPMIKFLIASGHRVNASNSQGETPIHHCRDVKSAKILIAAGAKVIRPNNRGYSALRSACEHNCKDVALVLFDAGANAPASKYRNEPTVIERYAYALACHRLLFFALKFKTKLNMYVQFNY